MTEAIKEINELLAHAQADLATCWEPSKRAARQYEVNRCKRFLAVLEKQHEKISQKT